MLCAACATTGGAVDEGEPVVFGEQPPAEVVPEPSLAEEGEVPLVVAESEHPVVVPPVDEIGEVIVAAPRRDRHEAIHDLVSGGDRPASGCRAPVCVYGKGEAGSASRTSCRIRLVERQEAGMVRRAPRDPPASDQVEARRQAHSLHHAHARDQGAARDGHRRRAADVRLLQGRGATEGLRQEVPGFRQRAAQEKAVAGRREDCEADHLSPIHRGHLRSAFRQRRQGIPAIHRAQGDRGIAPRKSAFYGISGRAPRRRRAGRSHRHPRGD